MSLLESTMIRVGNEEYARANASYGLTTLRDRHAQIHGRQLTLVFRGKSSVEHEVAIEDRRVIRIVHKLQDLAGQLLFQYLDDDGDRRPVQSGDVNEYLRAASDTDVTAKDFRTWTGTLITATGLAAVDRPKSDRDAKEIVATTIEGVAAQLGNTTAVCRNCYVHPTVIDRFLAGELRDQWSTVKGRPRRDLRADEHRLLSVLSPRRWRRVAA